MEGKSIIPDEKVEELFCYYANKDDQSAKWIGVTKSGKYYNVETHTYNIGSAYSNSHIYYPIEPDEVDYFKKIAEDRKRTEELKALEEERSRLEDQARLITNGSDKDFYKKKNTDIIWWVKDDNGEQKFSFDRETVFNLMTDYPEKLTPEQKEIFDKENPYWKVYFKKRNISMRNKKND